MLSKSLIVGERALLNEIHFENFSFHIPEIGPVHVQGTIRESECVLICGPSGCGKTTFLKAIAGLHPITAGHMQLGSLPLSSQPANQRRIGYVFQGGALFPHLNVIDNVAFGLRFSPHSKNWTEDLRLKEALRFLEKVGLGALANKSTQQISGGEKQRVALIRTLITQPAMLLLDEPLSAVDATKKTELQAWIRSLLDEWKLPTLYVTHDSTEATPLKARVVQWKEGAKCVLDF